MSLSVWCYLLGLIGLFAGLSAAAAPASLSRTLKALPRSPAAGYALSTVAWIWAGYALWNMNLDFMMPYQKLIPIAVLVCIPLTWFWLDNLLPCRAIGGLLTLFPYELLHIARVHASPGRLVVVLFAYLCIVAGMVLLLYPWKLRQMIAWLTARVARVRWAGVAVAFAGAAFIALGATVLR